MWVKKNAIVLNKECDYWNFTRNKKAKIFQHLETLIETGRDGSNHIFFLRYAEQRMRHKCIDISGVLQIKIK